MAFHAWMKGLNNPNALKQFRNMPPTHKREIAGHSIRSMDVPELFTTFFWECVGLWKRYKLLGLPYDGGWANNPAHLVKIIELFESEYQTVQADQLEENKRQPKKNYKLRPTQ